MKKTAGKKSCNSCKNDTVNGCKIVGYNYGCKRHAVEIYGCVKYKQMTDRS